MLLECFALHLSEDYGTFVVGGKLKMTAHGIKLDTTTIREFCARWKIKELRVFGSILRDDFRPDSDIDFIADFDEDSDWDLFDHMEMEEELAAIVGRNVDLLTRYSVETSQNRFYKHRILSESEQILAR